MAQTQEQVEEIIASLIIDNNTGAIDPAKMRQVLRAINARVPAPSDPSSATFSAPLAYDAYSNTVSIPKAGPTVDGYTDKADFRAIRFVPFGEMRIFKGPDSTPGSVALEPDDVAQFIFQKDGLPYFFIGAYKGGDPTDIDPDGLAGNWTLIVSNQYKQ